MKQWKELKLEELTVEQKLGLSMVAFFWSDATGDVEYIEELIKKRALGGVWIYPRPTEEGLRAGNEMRKRLVELADYPLLTVIDAERGFGEYTVGRHNAIACVDTEESAYAFGKVIAAEAARQGVNVICNPVLDMYKGGLENSICGHTSRSLGWDKHRVTELAAAEARGMHDGGCLVLAKHYPGASETQDIDAHMGETASSLTKEQLLEENLYPYIQLDKQGLLDGVMLGHSRYKNIDPDYPASLSKEMIQILRDTGYSGIALTDALHMMGAAAKFGLKKSMGLAVGNAAAVALPFIHDNEKCMNYLRECYDEGMIPEERLNKTVQDVLNMQHKLLSLPRNVEPTEKERADFNRLNTDSVYARVDEGLSVALDRNGKYRFTVLTENGTPEDMHIDTFTGNWYNPVWIGDKLKECFPNSTVEFLDEFPTPNRVRDYLEAGELGAEAVFVMYLHSGCYAGTERYTPRMVSMMKAMQVSNGISTVLQFGNPFPLEELPHIPRILVGTGSEQGVEATLAVLAGEYEAKGKMIYDVNFK